MTTEEKTITPYKVPYNEALEKGYVKEVYKGDSPWVYEANVWHTLYYTFNDSNLQHSDQAFCNNGYEDLSVPGLRQENLSWITELVQQGHTFDTIREWAKDNPVLLEVIDWCEENSQSGENREGQKEQSSSMYDFRTNAEDECYMLFCNSCGHTFLVDKTHKRYCPHCGPSTVTPLTVTKMTVDEVFGERPRTFAPQEGTRIERLNGDFNRGYTKALIDTRNFFEGHSESMAGSRLYSRKGIQAVLNCLAENKAELRETGDIQDLIVRKDGKYPVIEKRTKKIVKGGPKK